MVDTVRLKSASTIVFKQLKDEGVILDLKEGMYFGLNEVGSRIWALLLDGQSQREIVTTMLKEYNVTQERLERDVASWVGELKRRGLVVEDGEPPHPT
jgi:hypothetical protein